MERWEARLAHARAVRDAYVACGNPAPAKSDPPGGLYEVRPLIFKASIFWPALERAGHSHPDPFQCKCGCKCGLWGDGVVR